MATIEADGHISDLQAGPNCRGDHVGGATGASLWLSSSTEILPAQVKRTGNTKSFASRSTPGWHSLIPETTMSGVPEAAGINITK